MFETRAKHTTEAHMHLFAPNCSNANEKNPQIIPTIQKKVSQFKQFGYICLQNIIYVRNKGKAHYWSSYAFVRTELQQCERTNPQIITTIQKKVSQFKQFGYICLQNIIYVRNKGKAHYWSSYAFVRTELQQCERKKPTDNTNNSKESLSVQTIRLHLPSDYYICSKQGQSTLLKLICICPHRTAAIRTKKPTDNTNNSKESLSVPKFRSQVNRTTQPLHRLCTSFSTGGQIC